MSTLPSAVRVSGELTSEFCWFPGYMWRYVHCNNCNWHLGWKYFSQHLKPKAFYGLSGNNINFDSVSNLPMEMGDLAMDDIPHIDLDSSADDEW